TGRGHIRDQRLTVGGGRRNDEVRGRIVAGACDDQFFHSRHSGGNQVIPGKRIEKTAKKEEIEAAFGLHGLPPCSMTAPVSLDPPVFGLKFPDIARAEKRSFGG